MNEAEFPYTTADHVRVTFINMHYVEGDFIGVTSYGIMVKIQSKGMSSEWYVIFYPWGRVHSVRTARGGLD
jgi:hypothetical protein